MSTPHEKLLAEKVIGPKMSSNQAITEAKIELLKVLRTLKRESGLSDEEISSLLALVRKELFDKEAPNKVKT